MPRVTVIIPTFNNVTLLPETLDSVLGQTFTDFELIVVDDGSSDDTAAMIKRDYPQVRYVYQPNRGPAAARNAGVRLAHGEYVAFCDHDDLWNPDHLQVLLDGFAAHPHAALVFDNASCFGEGVDPGKVHLDDSACRALVQSSVSPKILLRDYPVASMSVVMVRRNYFDLVGGLNEQVGALDDLHFYVRISARYEVRFVNHFGCKKRLMSSNLSRLINIIETNVDYLEELWRNHPEVVDTVGAMSFRLRLARKYFKLARYYMMESKHDLARELFVKAYKANPLNLRYLLYLAMTR